MDKRTVKALITLCRPHQYVKNGFVWLPLFFDHKLTDPGALTAVLAPFALFCLAASAVYIFNDIQDVGYDQGHPAKKNRPLARGDLTTGQAWTAFAALSCAAALCSFLFLTPLLRLILGGYFVLNLAYSLRLKHWAIVDVFCIAIGLELRVFAGGEAAGAPVSHWIIIMTFLLAVFLALAKRRDDLLLAGNGASARPSLDGYTLEFVSLGMAVMASVTLVAYIMYTVSPEVAAKHGTGKLYLTGFWVISGILRYMQITFVTRRGGDPTRVVLTDIPLIAVILAWMASFYLLLYRT